MLGCWLVWFYSSTHSCYVVHEYWCLSYTEITASSQPFLSSGFYSISSLSLPQQSLRLGGRGYNYIHTICIGALCRHFFSIMWPIGHFFFLYSFLSFFLFLLMQKQRFIFQNVRVNKKNKLSSISVAFLTNFTISFQGTRNSSFFSHVAWPYVSWFANVISVSKAHGLVVVIM